MLTNNCLEYHDLSFLAYTRIKEMILNNEISSGEKIIQEKLALELGVSRMPLHKAFQMLENEMLVVSIPRRGIFVRSFDLQEIIDAFECRIAIESVAIRRAALIINSKEIDYLYALFEPFKNTNKKIDLNKYEESDKLFHKAILEISGNKMLQKMEIFGNIITKTYERSLIRGPIETYKEHIDIIDAIASHNEDLAEKLIRNHLMQSIEEFKKNKNKKLA